MTKRRSTKDFIELINQRFGDRFSYEKTEYLGKRKPVTVTCKHGDLTILANTLMVAKYGCNECGREEGKKRFLKNALNTHGKRYSYDKIDYVDTLTKVEVVCHRHGSFFVTPTEHYRKRVGCPSCGREKTKYTQDGWLQKAREAHGDRYDYRDVVYVHGNQPVKITCPDHGSFYQVGRSHIQGNGCPRCHVQRTRLSKDVFIQNAKEVHGNTYDYSKVVMVTSKDKVEIVCPKHGSFWITPNAHVACRGGCRRCKESKGETRVRTFLERHGIDFVQEYKLPDYRYRYDFYIPKYKMLIEFHGHQHFGPIERFGGSEAFKRVVKHDAIKVALAKEHDYHLHVLDHRRMKNDGVEINLEIALRFNGHVFEDGTTITGNKGPRRLEIVD